MSHSLTTRSPGRTEVTLPVGYGWDQIPGPAAGPELKVMANYLILGCKSPMVEGGPLLQSLCLQLILPVAAVLPPPTRVSPGSLPTQGRMVSVSLPLPPLLCSVTQKVSGLGRRPGSQWKASSPAKVPASPPPGDKDHPPPQRGLGPSLHPQHQQQ